ncbi:MAG TPA: patatin-like phospholipase family protein [Edaphobacter sp.]|nr:patatin-like phospholipase family protein [Edaphobacter sp.]
MLILSPRRCLLLALAGVLLSAGHSAFAQGDQVHEQPAQQPAPLQGKARPRIGLVLEGGGALGFAHIGVIEWMEEHHIPVDDVAGTSMGGLVGGLYASGLEPDEIRQFVERIDWTEVLSGQVPFPALSFRRKEDKLAYPSHLEFGLKPGLTLPSALNSGAAVGLLFDRTMLPYWDLRSFDDLPIPFRCVATELNTGLPHVFEDGSLAQALRATMSIPGLFAPVHHGNEIYADGAAVDNLPVDVARDMGAQVVISSYLNAGPVQKDVLGSMTGVMGRNVSIMVANNEISSLKNSDIVISSDVSKVGALDFGKNEQIIPLGYKAAELESKDLEKYALSDADWAAYIAARKARRKTLVPVPEFVEVYGISGTAQADIKSRFKKFIGKPIDTVQIEKSIADLQGTGLYSTINYNMTEQDGRVGLLIRPRNKTWGPPFMNLGLPILANDANNVQLGIGVRATFFNMYGPGSELRLEGMLGQPAVLSAELFKPLTVGSKAFIAPHGYLARQINPYYVGNQQLEQYREYRNGLGLDLGYQFNSRTELRAGEDVQWFNEHRTIGTGGQQEFSLIPFVSRLRFQYLGQNDYMVPTSGSVASVSYNYFTKRPNDAGGYSQASGRLEQFIPIRSKDVLFVQAQGGTSFGADNLGLAGLTLGGPLRLSAYARNELLGTDYFLGQVGYLHLLAKLNPIFADSVYAGGLYEIGKMYGGNAQTPSTPNDVAAVVVLKTFIGPVFGGLSIGDSDHRRWYLGVGRIF